MLSLLSSIYEYPYTMDALLSIELKRQLLDRMVYVLGCGHWFPVLHYINALLDEGGMDLSLVIHFVTEVTDQISGWHRQIALIDCL